MDNFDHSHQCAGIGENVIVNSGNWSVGTVVGLIVTPGGFLYVVCLNDGRNILASGDELDAQQYHVGDGVLVDLPGCANVFGAVCPGVIDIPIATSDGWLYYVRLDTGYRLAVPGDRLEALAS